ncbi:MAG: hypothetical protein K2X86_17695 [Cytophagaceae bacterium]|nr:hypothetical protein [Cytophagaceae bacterium]
MKQLVISLAIIFCLFSCTQDDCENVVDTSKIDANVKLVRLEESLFKAKTPQDYQKILSQYPLLSKQYFSVPPGDADHSNLLFQIYTNPALKEFSKEGERINNNFPDLESSINDLFKHIKYYFPSYHVPQVYTIVSTLPEPKYGVWDVIIEDSIVVIGIDYFYGSKSKIRPQGEYNYMLQRREPYYIVPSVALRLAQEDFVEYDLNDKTLLGEMIKWGKAHYFLERTMPCLPDSIVIGYTSQQIEDVQKNADIIWAYFIEHQLFYKTDEDNSKRFVGESPKVAVIGDKCPGRIGRYLGWQIVKTYMEKYPEITLEQLMKDTDSKKIFKLSKYKPKVK